VKASASGECEALSVSVCEREFVVAVCCGSLQVWRPMWRQVKARMKGRKKLMRREESRRGNLCRGRREEKV
jgi:hypothetical protein